MYPESPTSFDDFMAMLDAIREKYGDITSDPAAALAFQDALTLLLIGNQADQAYLQRDQAQFARDQMGMQIEESGDQRDFRRTVEFPFQAEQMQQRLEEGRLNLDTSRVQFENQRELERERLGQLQQGGTHDIQMADVAKQTALINLAMQREQLAHMLSGPRGMRGSTSYTPRGGFQLPSGAIF